MATAGNVGGGTLTSGTGLIAPRPNVSVTSINCDASQSSSAAAPIVFPAAISNGVGQHFSGSANGSAGAVRITVPKMEESDESDTELSNIEHASKVNRRNNNSSNGVPRPMSWEGALSGPEDAMDVENSSSNGPSNCDTKACEATTNGGNNNFTVVPKPEVPEAGPCGTYSHKKYPDVINLKYEPGTVDAMTPPLQLHGATASTTAATTLNSPLLARSKTTTLLPANPSPDSAIHSVYTHSSPSQSPLTSRHAPYTPSLSRNNSDASHSSCYSYSSEFSPTHSPIQSRHNVYGNNFNGSPLHHSVLYRPMIEGGNDLVARIGQDDALLEGDPMPSAGISRQQLINSPCPICGDKISGFHYGIFSCESCKGFFKRTVQNRKNYVCLRGAACPVTIATRKKCPACRFEKCLQRGMKLEAIREDRTRGGRSTYQCSYTLPNSMMSPSSMGGMGESSAMSRNSLNGPHIKTEGENGCISRPRIPNLLQEIMDVEHLWQYTEADMTKLNQQQTAGSSSKSAPNPLLASAGLNSDNSNPDLIANLCNVADHYLYKIVKWCKSLPLFKSISIDDQICLLINSWCELLLFSCCFRSMTTPGEIRISSTKSIALTVAKSNGLQACIERMLNLTDHLRRLRVDRYEYVAMKVIVLLQSDTSELQEPEKVRASQERALQALQAYTLSHYPDAPSKFGELLLRIPELQRTCQVGKEMLTIKSKDGEEDFNLLMELLRGEH